MIRINKFLSESGICSRRKADELVLAGKITVNGQPVTTLGLKIDPEKDVVRIDGKIVEALQKLAYYALYKPRGVISTAYDEHGRQSVVDLVPREPRVYPIGRLDEDSEGLIILTNDGVLTQRLTHPSFEHEKEYEVSIRAKTSNVQDFEATIKSKFERGLLIDGQLMKAKSVSVEPLSNKGYLLKIILTTGFNRQIRKMCAKMGLEVTILRRTRIVGLSLDKLNLQPGKYIEITKDEIL